MTISNDLLRLRQALPLDIKISMAERRIVEFVETYGLDGVYISFSGGIDSTVLLDIARKIYPTIRAAYADTWMEFPQVRSFVHENFSNVDIVKPYLTMKEVIAKCGWCFPSKDVAAMIEAARRDVPWAINKLNGLNADGTVSEYREQYKKWKILVDSPIYITPNCCIELKERPLRDYEARTGRHPIVALMADESARRKEAYLRTGCNLYEEKQVYDPATNTMCTKHVSRPISKPLGFWTKNDILQYVYCYKLPIAMPYGTVGVRGFSPGQLFLLPVAESISCRNCSYYTSGESRTGCIFCLIGCHLDGFKKFERLKQYAPKLYDYCMEELGEKEVISWIKRHIVR